MGFFKNLFSSNKPTATELKPIAVQKPGIGMRLKKQTQHTYKAEFALVYNERPVGKIAVTEKGFSRDKVAKKLSDGMSVKLLSVVQIKEKQED